MTGRIKVTPEEAAYGALWRMITDDPVLHRARNALRTKLNTASQKRAIEWACATLAPVSDAEILGADLP